MDTVAVAGGTGRIGLRRHLQPQPAPGGEVYLVGEAEVAVVRGRHVDDLVVLLDGRHDAAGVRAGMAGLGVGADDVTSMLAEFDRSGLLVRYREEDEDAQRATLAYWDAVGVEDACSAADLIASGRIDLLSIFPKPI